ncbi:MAG: AmmeMemoRadiSam system radical SAM enzyme, partial [Candidatus Aenigmatarchaeota archaeon]
CGVRENKGGKLFSLVYGKLCSMAVDNILKKPFNHFAVGSQCLSIATVGCNLNCVFCQNWELAHPKTILGEDRSPEFIVDFAKDLNLPGIAYTYTEPTIAWEYYFETMKLAKKAGLYNVWVSNGYTNPEPIKKAARYLDAINVDLKGDLKLYKELCGVPSEKPVYTALRAYKKAGVWIEITNLMIPGFNDKPAQVKKLVGWVKANLGVNTPIHFTRFFPYHKMSREKPTPVAALERAHKIATGLGMKWVYLGNVPGHEYESTYCPKCGELLIRRIGFQLGSFSEKCKCGEKLALAGKKWSGVIQVPKL